MRQWGASKIIPSRRLLCSNQSVYDIAPACYDETEVHWSLLERGLVYRLHAGTTGVWEQSRPMPIVILHSGLAALPWLWPLTSGPTAATLPYIAGAAVAAILSLR